MPDKAIDLLDEAASSLSLESAELNETLQIREELLMLKEKREQLEGETPTEEKEAQKCYEEIAGIRANELKLSARLKELEPCCDNIELTEAEIAAVAFVVSDVGDNEVAGFVGGKGFPINIASSGKVNAAIRFGVGFRSDDLSFGGDGEEVGAGAGVV